VKIAAFIFQTIVAIRNFLYDNKIMLSKSVDVPTICVGNLAVGGTGKTPHCEYLIRLLQDKYHIVFLSRGYKRKTKGVVIANEQSTVQTIGDEPMQIHQKFPDLPIVVAEDRLQGIRVIKEHFPDTQLVLLDDAFQHRRLICGLNILLTAYDNLYVNDHFLPAGRLRDNRFSAYRSHIIIVSKSPETLRPIDKRVTETSLALIPSQHIYFTQINYLPLQPVFADGNQEPVQITRNTHLVLLTGIADNKAMVAHLKSITPYVHELTFADHHRFKRKDMLQLEQTISRHKATMIVTTEKDAIRLNTSDVYPESLRCITYRLPIEIAFQGNEEAFQKQIEDYLYRCHKPIKQI